MTHCCTAQYRADLVAQLTIPRIIGGAIAALVAVVALAILTALFVAPGVIGVAAIATFLGGTSVAISVTGILTIVMTALSTLFFGVCNCTPIKKKSEPTEADTTSSSASVDGSVSGSEEE